MSPGQRRHYFGHSSDEMSLHYSHETDRKRLARKQMKIIPFPMAHGE
jgi:hypothetical protein